MVSLSNSLPVLAIPRPENLGAIGGKIVLPKCEHMKSTKYILMMCNIGTLARFYVKIGNIQNIFHMMGNSKLKMTFKLNEWAVAR